jgi:hypothetical protein
MNYHGVKAHTRTISIAALAVAGSIAAVGCGSSGSDKSTATTRAPVPTTAAASGATTSAVGGGSATGGVALPVKDASYKSGRVHIDFGADSGGSVEIDGEGAIVGGFASLTFADTNRQVSAVFVVGGDQPGGVAFTWDGVSSGGEFGKQCTINFTKGDQSALEGEFACTGMDGVKLSSTNALHVDAKGTFKLANT